MKNIRTADDVAEFMRASVGHWLAGWAPYCDVLAGLNLPPRGKVGSKANMRRALMVQRALHAKKLAIAKQAKKQRTR